MSKQRYVPMPIGASSLITIFAVLCLLTFSLLSLSTTYANKKLSDKSAQAVANYYKADFEAEQILSKMREEIYPDRVKKTGKNIYSYECEISDSKSLSVEVMVDGETFNIRKWNVVSTIEWEANDSIEVWDGQIEE